MPGFPTLTGVSESGAGLGLRQRNDVDVSGDDNTNVKSIDVVNSRGDGEG